LLKVIGNLNFAEDTFSGRNTRGDTTATAAAFVVLVALAGVDQAAAARAAEKPALLNEVARVYSLGVGEVRCPSQPEWDADPHRDRFGWGYTNIRSDLHRFAADDLRRRDERRQRLDTRVAASGRCLDARSRGVPPPALALPPERGEGRMPDDRLLHRRGRRLGASDPQAQQLYPYGLALHELELDLYPWHRDPKCIVPPWLPPSGP
jgi:hypothetical protein